MIKAFLFGLAAIFAMGATAVNMIERGPVNTVYQQRKAEMFDPSVQIINFTKGAVCSGTFIKSAVGPEGFVENLVLSAKHCVSGLQDVYTVRYGGHDYSAVPRIIPESLQKDAAIFQLASGKTFPTAKLASKKDYEDLFFSQEAYSVSYPGGSSKTFTIGIFQGVEEVQFPTPEMREPLEPFFKVAVNNMPGSSGSALFVQNSRNEYVIVGVLTSGVDYLSWYTPWTDVMEIVEEIDG